MEPTCDAAVNGRVTYRLPLLRERGGDVRTLDDDAVVPLAARPDR